VVAVIEVDVSQTKPEDVAKIEQEVDALSKRLSQFPAVQVENKGLAERLTVKREVEREHEQERAVNASRRRLHEVFERETAKMPGPNRTPQWLKQRGYSFSGHLSVLGEPEHSA